GTATPGQGPYGNYVNLVAAHGIDCMDAALVNTSEIAFPTPRARDLTPRTAPSTWTASVDALPAWLTSMESLPDGSVALTLGVAGGAPQGAPAARPSGAPDANGYVART